MAKPNDPDGPLHKWGEPEGTKDFIKKLLGKKQLKKLSTL